MAPPTVCLTMAATLFICLSVSRPPGGCGQGTLQLQQQVETGVVCRRRRVGEIRCILTWLRAKQDVMTPVGRSSLRCSVGPSVI